MRTFLVAGAASLLAMFGCGSSVTTGTGGNGAGSGGSGVGAGTSDGSGASQSSGVTSASGTPSTTGTGGAGGAALCELACARLDMLGCGSGPDCVQSCQEGYVTDPRCAPELDQLAECVAGLPRCDVAAFCQAEFDAYSACADGHDCQPGECGSTGTSGGQTECVCGAICSDGTEISADCTSFDGTIAKCECLVNGMLVGGCEEPARLMCELDAGCCSALF